MKSKDLYRWADHRATMLWVSLKCLVFLTVGVSIVVAVGDLSSGASTALSIAVAGIGFSLVRSVRRGHRYCNHAKRHGRRPQSKRVWRKLCEGAIPVYFGLMTLVMLGTQ